MDSFKHFFWYLHEYRKNSPRHILFYLAQIHTEVSHILEKQPIKLCHKGRYYDDESKSGGILHGALTKLSLSLVSTEKN